MNHRAAALARLRSIHGTSDVVVGLGSSCTYPRSPPNRSPVKRVRFGKEEGVNGYGVFAALTQTAETECS